MKLPIKDLSKCSVKDLKVIAWFNRVVLNYLKMIKLENKGEK